MTNNEMPDPFNDYWKMKKIPKVNTSNPVTVNNKNHSKEWKQFLLAIKEKIHRDLNK